jgi:peptide methionine sulfoxide reductase MsrA
VFFVIHDPTTLNRQGPGQGYCSFVVAPKVAKFRKHFAEKMKVRV